MIMNLNRRTTRQFVGSLSFLTLMGACILARAATITYSGPLLVTTDLGTAPYSGTPPDTIITISIDDVTGHGFITDGVTRIDFDCCIAAGHREKFNDYALDAESASELNLISSCKFNKGDKVDVFNIEGDVWIVPEVPQVRMEVGVSYVLDRNAFADKDPRNFRPNLDDILLVVFFVVFFWEDVDKNIYDAVGSCPGPGGCSAKSKSKCTISVDAAAFRRGDCNDDGWIDISDAICILIYLFLGGANPGCIAVADTNGDGAANVSDAAYLLNYLFLRGVAPAAPFPECGPATLPQDVCQTPPTHCQQ